MATTISQLTEDTAPATNSLLSVVVNGITRKTTLENVLGLVTGGTVASITGGTNVSVSSVGSPTQDLTISFNLPGMVVPYAGSDSKVPAGWLFCNGQAVLRSGISGYPELYEVIGTTYGNGDGTLTFNVPDLRGRIPFGKAESSSAGSPLNGATFASGNFHSLASTGGQENHLLLASQTSVKDHTHSASGNMTVYGEYADTANWDARNCNPDSYSDYGILGEVAPGARRSASSTGNTSALNSVDAALPHNNMPPVMVLSYLIKT